MILADTQEKNTIMIDEQLQNGKSMNGKKSLFSDWVIASFQPVYKTLVVAS